MNDWREVFIEKMVKQYIITGLWATNGINDEPLDKTYGMDDVSEEFKQQSRKDCAYFYAVSAELYESDEDDAERIGHDFWLTRNRHGAGFWDGDYKRGDKITELVQRLFNENDEELRNAIKGRK